ncbi:cysteine desulfurase-like protein [Flexivirga oryzae]|uniref:Cysteine desulfurase family protein (TIGR01976 family) n=1 Tax=Flexivirga oryzae TaxID=1794944 RepID=A0A839N325_9MICO|nr:cysteine desulfurase family protein (TIGR01976 family) [Flexivirga oryzae]
MGEPVEVAEPVEVPVELAELVEVAEPVEVAELVEVPVELAEPVCDPAEAHSRGIFERLGMEQTATQRYDVTAVREQFPSLRSGRAHFDAPGGTQTPEPVARAVYDALAAPLSNRGRRTQAERNADDLVRGARAAMGDLLGVDAGTVAFGRSATALTFAMSRTLAQGWRSGDEIILSRLDHDANVGPWLLAAQRSGVDVKWADFDPATGELDLATIADQLSGRTRLVALTGASNLIGTQPDIAAVAGAAHRTPALVYVDGVHHTAHSFVDVPALGADLYVCSPYKFLGPHCGVLTGRADLLRELTPDKLRPSTDETPERFELGTLPYELLAGVTAAVDFLADLVPGTGARRDRLRTSLGVLEEHEDTLRKRVEDGLALLPQVTVHSRAARRTPTLFMTFADRPAEQVSDYLETDGIDAPAGTFYAYEPARRLGVDSGLRIGLAPYSTQDDIDRFITSLGNCLRGADL